MSKSKSAKRSVRAPTTEAPKIRAPDAWARSMAIMGTIRTALICCASLNPFTLAEMMTVSPTLARAIAGVRPKMRTIQSRLGSRSLPKAL